MRTRRKLALLWLSGVALVALALLLTDRLLWSPGLTEDNVRRIRPGMTLAEVEALLGGPASQTIDLIDEPEYRGYRWLRHWKAEGAAVDVLFFPNGRVMAAGGGSGCPARSPACAAGWAGDASAANSFQPA